LKLFFLKGGHEVPSVLERVTGRLKGGPLEEHAARKAKKRRAGDMETEGLALSPAQQQGEYNEGGWQPSESQGQDFGMGGVGQNVDPGLQMAHGT
jgi:hypothetical protein